jgi:hypothetical protein
MSKLVEFTQDIAPYCKGDVVKLEDDEIKRVEKRAKSLNIESAYKAYAKVGKAVDEKVAAVKEA